MGDALVAQIPGLLISVAAAMVVSRVGKERDIGKQIVGQLFISPKVLGITAAIMFILGIIPNMPHLVFLTIASVLAYGAWMLANKPPPADPEAAAPAPTSDGEASWDDFATCWINWAWSWVTA